MRRASTIFMFALGFWGLGPCAPGSWAPALGATAMAAGSTAAPAVHPIEFANTDAVLRWINGYRLKPDVAQVPNAIRALSRFDAFRESESSAVYVGFLAGVIGANPRRADEMVERMFDIKPEDHWVIVRAIAYSGMPGWKAMLTRHAARMPTRAHMIEKYQEGKLPTLSDLVFEKSPGAFEKIGKSMGHLFTSDKPSGPAKLEPNAEILDTLWGYYFATAEFGPIDRIARLLPWSKDRSNTDKLTVGSMAKYTLAQNASHDPVLLAMLKREAPHEPDEVKATLLEIVEAVETMEIARIRKEALASIDDLKRKGPGNSRDLSTWGQVGQGALALGCIAAAVAGQVEIGVPCVVGGALSGAAINYWGKD
jgi:hypothetical protein